MLLTLLQNRTAEASPGTGGSSTSGSLGGFVMGGGGSPGGSRIREAYVKPILQRMMELRAPKVRPAKERAAKRTKAIEIEAARAIVESDGEAELSGFIREWKAQRPVVPEKAQQIPMDDLFLAQVAFRIRQLNMLADDEEDAIIALLLA